MGNISNFKVLFTSFLALLVFSIFSIGTASANEDSDEILTGGHEATVTITNDQTGEVTILDPEETKKNLKIKKVKSKGEAKSANFEIFVPIEDPSLITPTLVSGGTKTAGGVTATLNADYNLRNSNQEIQLNRVYGTWKPSSSMYYLTNRTVNAHSGSVWGSSLSTKYPTSNIFGYSTGWGYNLFGGGDGSPRAWTSAKINISGMTSTYTISLQIVFP